MLGNLHMINCCMLFFCALSAKIAYTTQGDSRNCDDKVSVAPRALLVLSSVRGYRGYQKKRRTCINIVIYKVYKK